MMSARRRLRSKWGILPFLGLALFLHQAVVLIGALYSVLHPNQQNALEEPIDVALMDEPPAGLDNLESDPKLGTQEEEAEAAKQPKEEPAESAETKAPGQVVDVPPPPVEQAPKDAKYASEYNTRVEHETKARSTGKTGAAPGPVGPTARAVPPPSAEPSPAKQPSFPTESKAPGPLALVPRPGAVPPAERPGLPESPQPTERSPDGMLAPAPQGEPSGPPSEQQPGAGAGGHLSLHDLLPSDRQLARAISGGGGGTYDYLKDIDDGDSTALNSKKWKFASFFNRVKRTVAEHWRPGVEYRRRDPTGNIYGLRDRVTVLRVALRPDGTVANLAVEQPSGVDFLDDEAVSAFREAQPFPNPPRQLVDQHGMILFRFAFIFEISSTPSFKVFRYN